MKYYRIKTTNWTEANITKQAQKSGKIIGRGSVRVKLHLSFSYKKKYCLNYEANKLI